MSAHGTRRIRRAVCWGFASVVHQLQDLKKGIARLPSTVANRLRSATDRYRGRRNRTRLTRTQSAFEKRQRELDEHVLRTNEMYLLYLIQLSMFTQNTWDPWRNEQMERMVQYQDRKVHKLIMEL
uniref:Uncharacterized protein n=1 Tax=Anopheles atroparvus TaxID=41427 RepID=A0AAG5DLQ4_ANOAO